MDPSGAASELADRLDFARSSALAAWIVLDVTEPMAMSWRPRLAPDANRAALDPPLAAA
ncbi:MAG: hypothetical protein M0Z95_18030 [Actinomycetota bacterium]|nr:hypothetical protein [Actinomycetota bacterium]